MTHLIQEAYKHSEIAACWPVMRQLRPHFDDCDIFIETVLRMQTTGYRLVGLRDDGAIRACAGFRLLENLVSARHMYVDDLISDETQRSKGYGKALLDWLRERAKVEGCKRFELDSGTHRVHAHRFYMREGMVIVGFHFKQDL